MMGLYLGVTRWVQSLSPDLSQSQIFVIGFANGCYKSDRDLLVSLVKQLNVFRQNGDIDENQLERMTYTLYQGQVADVEEFIRSLSKPVLASSSSRQEEKEMKSQIFTCIDLNRGDTLGSDAIEEKINGVNDGLSNRKLRSQYQTSEKEGFVEEVKQHNEEDSKGGSAMESITKRLQRLKTDEFMRDITHLPEAEIQRRLHTKREKEASLKMMKDMIHEEEIETTRQRQRRIEGIDRVDCQICLENIPFEDYLPLDLCGHLFHRYCIGMARDLIQNISSLTGNKCFSSYLVAR